MHTPSKPVADRSDIRTSIPTNSTIIRRSYGTPQAAISSNAKRENTPGGTAKYFRVDDNGNRFEIDPPVNGNFTNLTPSRQMTNYNNLHDSEHKNHVYRPADLPKSPIPNKNTNLPITPTSISGKFNNHLNDYLNSS
jgi:hypothetical protein